MDIEAEAYPLRGVATAEWHRHWRIPLASAFGYATAVLHVYGIGAFIKPYSTSSAGRAH